MKTTIDLPCKIGDSVWINSKYRREKRPKYGRVTSMTFSDDMRLIIGVYRVGKGEWGKNVFGTEKEAEESMK